MKKKLLIIFCCLATQTHGALPRLKMIATRTVASAKNLQLRNLTTLNRPTTAAKQLPALSSTQDQSKNSKNNYEKFFKYFNVGVGILWAAAVVELVYPTIYTLTADRRELAKIRAKLYSDNYTLPEKMDFLNELSKTSYREDYKNSLHVEAENFYTKNEHRLNLRQKIQLLSYFSEPKRHSVALELLDNNEGLLSPEATTRCLKDLEPEVAFIRTQDILTKKTDLPEELLEDSNDLVEILRYRADAPTFLAAMKKLDQRIIISYSWHLKRLNYPSSYISELFPPNWVLEQLITHGKKLSAYSVLTYVPLLLAVDRTDFVIQYLEDNQKNLGTRTKVEFICTLEPQDSAAYVLKSLTPFSALLNHVDQKVLIEMLLREIIAKFETDQTTEAPYKNPNEPSSKTSSESTSGADRDPEATPKLIPDEMANFIDFMVTREIFGFMTNDKYRKEWCLHFLTHSEKSIPIEVRAIFLDCAINHFHIPSSSDLLKNWALCMLTDYSDQFSAEEKAHLLTYMSKEDQERLSPT